MHITKIRSQDMRLPLLDEADLEFDESVNLFVGPNASARAPYCEPLRRCTPGSCRWIDLLLTHTKLEVTMMANLTIMTMRTMARQEEV